MELKVNPTRPQKKSACMLTRPTNRMKKTNWEYGGVAQLPPLPVHQQPGKLQLQTRGFGHAHLGHKEK